MLINKYPHKKVKYDLRLSINSMVLKRTENVKYLDVRLDDKLYWSPHVKYISLQLARYSGIFYRIYKLVPTSVLIMYIILLCIVGSNII